VWVQGISFVSVAAGAPNAVECLGVKGDVSATETGFLSFGCNFSQNAYAYAVAGVGFYAKNAGALYALNMITNCSYTGVNLGSFYAIRSFLGNITLSFDPLAVDGKFQACTGILTELDYCHQSNGNITVTGMKYTWWRYHAMGSGTVTLNGVGVALPSGSIFHGCRLNGPVNLTSTGGSLGTLNFIDSYFGGAFAADGLVSFTANACRFMSTMSVASGAGTAVLKDCTVMGVITDPDNKLAELYNNQIYVNGSAPAGGNGTFVSPFTLIQSALDKAATFNTARTGVPILIDVANGTYAENLTWFGQEPITLTGSSVANEVSVKPASGCPLTITNATPASLATYNISGTYSDLVNDGPGPGTVSIRNILFRANAGVFPGIRALGVKGDPGTPTTTAFLTFFTIDASAGVSAGGTVDIFAKNVNMLLNTMVKGGIMQLRNVSYPDLSGGRLGGNLDIEYNAASADGTPVYGLGYLEIYLCTVMGGTGIQIAGSQVANIRECDIETGVLNCDGTSVVTIQGGRVGGAVDLEAGVTFTASGTEFMSTLTAAAGAGVVTLNNSPVLGATTDAGGKIIHNDNVKSGVHTFGGAGDGVIDFSALPGIMADFPAGTTYSVDLSCEDTGAGYSTLMVKTGTIALTGFTITASAACKANWTARKTN
jgi:hypothetical protein